jgi:excisionase family DNA binding protein
MPTIKTQLAPLDSAQRYSVPEAIAYLRTSRKTIYEMIAAGRLHPIKEGRRTLIAGLEIAQLSRPPAVAA